jgi:hypothetical protein
MVVSKLIRGMAKGSKPALGAGVAQGLAIIGMTGFEPATSCSQSRRATKLRYIPDCETLLTNSNTDHQKKSIPKTKIFKGTGTGIKSGPFKLAHQFNLDTKTYP